MHTTLTSRGLPLQNNEVKGYVDGGGTQCRVKLFGPDGRVIFEHIYQSSQFNSPNTLLAHAFCDANVVPGEMTYALAGPVDLEAGRVTMAIRPGWPDFVLSDFYELTGCGGKLHNDVEVLAADAVNTDPRHLTAIRSGHVWPEGRAVVLTVSTGVGPAMVENGHTTATELGHMGAQPLTDLERSYTSFAARELGAPFVEVEHVISGHYGFPMAVLWARSIGLLPSARTQQLIDELTAKGKDCGPAICSQVLVDPSFAGVIIRVIGGLYGTYLRELMATLQPTAGVHLVGGVNRDIGILANPYNSPFLERIADRRLPHPDKVDSFAIYHNTDPELAERGAKVLALAG